MMRKDVCCRVFQRLAIFDKGVINMKEVQAKEEPPFESWSKLIEETMSGYPFTQAFTSAARDDKEDPWFALIDRLWDASPTNSLMPMDPGEILDTFEKVWLDALSNPTRLWALYSEFVQNYTQLMMTETFRLWGLEKESKPVIEPEHGDKRFIAPDWQQNPVFDALKQSYLLAATTLLKTASEIEGLDEHLASGPVRFILGGSGHIAGIINPPSKGKGYWTNEKPVKTADEWL